MQTTAWFATGGLIALGCCLCILLIPLSLLIYVLVTTYEASTISCSQNANIWVYSVTCLCCGAVIAGSAHLLQMVSVWLSLLPTIYYAFVAVWGTLLWAVMDEPCYLTYKADFWSLLLLFKLCVIQAYIGIVISFCLAALQIGTVLFNAYSRQGSTPTESSPMLPKEQAHTA
mmetsp:Transcript_50762/g.106081  ORF Transcript_50762/g.106081 Transcript_50762/m.106081 type:complete len:172 (-) Transcript_50762:175-690(-)